MTSGSGDRTRASLISRVRNPKDEAAWREFEERYRELLVRFARGIGLQQADAEDVVQNVLSSLVGSLAGFEYDPKKGRFRDYLYRCTRNAVARSGGRQRMERLAHGTETGVPLEDAGQVVPELAEIWEREWVAHHFRLAMGSIRSTFDPRYMSGQPIWR